MENSNLFVGLDVHKETIEVALAKEIQSYGTMAGDLGSVDRTPRSPTPPSIESLGSTRTCWTACANACGNGRTS